MKMCSRRAGGGCANAARCGGHEEMGRVDMSRV